MLAFKGCHSGPWMQDVPCVALLGTRGQLPFSVVWIPSLNTRWQGNVLATAFMCDPQSKDASFLGVCPSHELPGLLQFLDAAGRTQHAWVPEQLILCSSLRPQRCHQPLRYFGRILVSQKIFTIYLVQKAHLFAQNVCCMRVSLYIYWRGRKGIDRAMSFSGCLLTAGLQSARSCPQSQAASCTAPSARASKEAGVSCHSG